MVAMEGDVKAGNCFFFLDTFYKPTRGTLLEPCISIHFFLIYSTVSRTGYCYSPVGYSVNYQVTGRHSLYFILFCCCCSLLLAD